MRGFRMLYAVSMFAVLSLTACGSGKEAETETSAKISTEAGTEADAEAGTKAGNETVKSGAAVTPEVFTINQSFGDGQKVTNVVVAYPENIEAATVDVDSFEVKDRTVTAVHVNNEAARTSENVDGRYVVLDLEIQSPLLDDRYATDGRMVNDTVTDSAAVVQKKDIQSVEGTVYPAGEEEFTTPSSSGIMGNSSKIYVTRDKFEDNHFFTDPEWKTVLHYNLYKPEGYEDSGETYPLVLFMPDAGSVSSDWEKVLEQGNGGTVWAGEDWQKDHPCFVVTMIYDDKFINDYWEYYENYVEGTMNLVRALSAQYPVDSDRIYTTGQSMGCMCSLIMMSKDPDLFAGAYCVAGKWNPESLEGLKDSNILVLNSEDDSLETGMLMDQTAEVWERSGETVARGYIDGIAGEDTLTEQLEALLSQEAHLYYCKIKTGTGSMDAEGNPLKGSHRNTWRLAYDLPMVKEWLFRQTK